MSFIDDVVSQTCYTWISTSCTRDRRLRLSKASVARVEESADPI